MSKTIVVTIISVVIVIFAAMTIIVVIDYSSRMKSEQLRMASFHPMIAQTAIAPVEYELRGEGPIVLVSHGITGGIDQCFALAKTYLNQEYLKVLAVSRFGYGGSTMPNSTCPADQADAFAALLNELDIKKVHVLGNSGGAAAALQFAIKYPEKCLSLYLVSSNFPNSAAVPPKPVMQVIFGSNFIYWATIRLFERGMLGMAGVPSEILAKLERDEQEEILNVLFSGLPIKSRTKGVINDLYVSNVDMKKGYDFSQIKSLVLMAHAKDDPAGNFEFAKNVSSKIKNCRFIIIESGGHLLLGSEKMLQEASYELIMSAN